MVTVMVKRMHMFTSMIDDTITTTSLLMAVIKLLTVLTVMVKHPVSNTRLPTGRLAGRKATHPPQLTHRRGQAMPSKLSCEAQSPRLLQSILPKEGCRLQHMSYMIRLL